MQRDAAAAPVAVWDDAALLARLARASASASCASSSPLEAAARTKRPPCEAPPSLLAARCYTCEVPAALVSVRVVSVEGWPLLRGAGGDSDGVTRFAAGALTRYAVSAQVVCGNGEALTPLVPTAAPSPVPEVPPAVMSAAAGGDGGGGGGGGGGGDVLRAALPPSARLSFSEAGGGWIVLPLRLAALPPTAWLRLVLEDASRGPVAHAGTPLFTPGGALRCDLLQLRWRPLTEDIVASGSGSGGDDAEGEGEAEELLLRRLHGGALPAVPWLDRIAERALSHQRRQRGPPPARRRPEEHALGTVTIDFPRPSCRGAVATYTAVPPSPAMACLAASLAARGAAGPARLPPHVPYADHYCLAREHNVHEAAAALLARAEVTLRSGGGSGNGGSPDDGGAAALPSARERQLLADIARRPPLSQGAAPPRAEEVALLWRARHYARRHPALFLPFVRSVDWGRDAAAAAAAAALLPGWRGVELQHTLACLSYQFRAAPAVRAEAVRRLAAEPDATVALLAPQLAEAVRHDGPAALELTRLLAVRACRRWEVCAALWWAADAAAALERGRRHPCTTLELLPARLRGALQDARPEYVLHLHTQTRLVAAVRRLARALRALPGDRPTRILKGTSLLRHHLAAAAAAAAAAGSSSSRLRLGVALSSATAAASATTAAAAVSSNNSSPSAAADAAAAALVELFVRCQAEALPVTLPTHPGVTVTGVVADSLYIFKSAKQPLRLSFTLGDAGGAAAATVEGEAPLLPPPVQTAAGAAAAVSPARVLSVMFKDGDDVRQDQLVTQIIRLADALLRREGLDLCLTPYQVCVTGPEEGLIELVPDVVTFQSVQRDVLRFLRTHNPTAERLQRALDRYKRSFAGYCVLTFVLGVGDRHLENVLVCADGRLLHIDYGYVLGSDPKPFPPAMKVTREMIEALGGPDSADFAEAKSYCCSAYNILRHGAPLLLHALLLLVHAARLPQITGADDDDSAEAEGSGSAGGGEASGTAGAAAADPTAQIAKVQAKLRLDLADPEATQYLQSVLADSVGSIFANLWDALHAAAQSTRA